MLESYKNFLERRFRVLRESLGMVTNMRYFNQHTITIIITITLVYKIFLKNALYSVFNWFPLILGRWFRIRSPFSAVWLEFCSAASFVFFGLQNQILENWAIFFLKISNIFEKTIKLWMICKKIWKSAHWFRRYCLAKFEKTDKIRKILP